MAGLWVQKNADSQAITSPSTMPPWGTSIISGERRGEYEADGWQEIAESEVAVLEFRFPPPPVVDRVAALYAEYDENRLRLERYLGDACNFANDNILADELRAQITALDGKYIANVEAILDG